MDEQIEQIARAMIATETDLEPTDAYLESRKKLARAAHGVMAGRIAELEGALRQIEAGAINGKAEFLRICGKRKQATWLAVNALEDYLAASGGTARAALAPKARHE